MGVLSLLVTVGCALLHVAIPLVGRGDRRYTAATSRWDCLEAATIEDLLAKDPEPFKSVADGKRPCFILKRSLTNGPQLVQRLVERGVLEGDTLRYGPLASPFDLFHESVDLTRGLGRTAAGGRRACWCTREQHTPPNAQNFSLGGCKGSD